MTAVLFGLDAVRARGQRAIAEVVDAVAAGSRVPCGLIANVTAEEAQRLRADEELMAAFDVVVLSSDIGVAMPDHRAFAVAVEALGARPGATLFVDTHPEHCAAAAEMGLRNTHSSLA